MTAIVESELSTTPASPLDTNKLKALCEAVIRDIGNDGDLPIALDWGWANLGHKSLPELRAFLGLSGAALSSTPAQMPCEPGEPMMHGPKPYPWCKTHDDLMMRCELLGRKSVVATPAEIEAASRELVVEWNETANAIRFDSDAELLIDRITRLVVECSGASSLELRDAAKSALEWFAGFPHKGETSAFDISTAAQCYNQLETALAIVECGGGVDGDDLLDDVAGDCDAQQIGIGQECMTTQNNWRGKTSREVWNQAVAHCAQVIRARISRRGSGK